MSAADTLAARLARLSTVRETRTLSDFVPGDQTQKLAAIGDASTLLDLSLNPIVTDPPPNDPDVIAALRQTAADLRGRQRRDPGRHGRSRPNAYPDPWTGSPARRPPCARAFLRY